ncbi:UDP-N-acetylmuramoyl-tripeptide--D-alanyl-D-alanine ligase [Cellulophaga omnivescoria]|uniref:UDP-N-acetylmuramoyl-tripeptide--D-alanyl-D- alanine ligase n=1 Tax=Cellulophaga omnivescoria TaxID=1888890 RepID=UPI0022EFF7E3|nr:UDP-N-acetylmuramoyl-tripeptide--D-alanyl-D-alanine ligase [Cellulophaga omnivescoria]WBU88255.1 UDP-N-acetylmuramoyl-tripeptide--D-alanyl-D-alanine ligase [Cellulophaga omnivescoria]
MTIAQIHQLFLTYSTVCTDTRKITKDCIFFALKGDNFNGNKYAAEALEKGAAYAIVDEKKYATTHKFILVEDVLQTLQKLGNYHRKHCTAKVIGLTGSNGKTTTKELIKAVIQKKYKTVATVGNLNNHIGVPLTLLTIKEDTEIAIVEMGANHLKEIEFLSSLAEPDYGYITNFGKAHLEGFGSTEGVIQGKSELYNYLTTNQKHIFLNADDPIQEKKLGSYVKKIGFSATKENYYNIVLLGADPFVTIKVEDATITSNLVGAYNFTNCCAAIIMGKYFNISLPQIKEAIEGYVPANNRSQILEQNGYKIILDAYNANPTSMAAALDNFNGIQATHKIVFLGDMFELGTTAATEHQYIADKACKMNFTSTFLIGENFAKVKTEAEQLASFDHLKEYLKKHPLQPNSNLLIKGSRGMALERILNLL